MTNKQTGWLLGLTALGMMLGLMSIEVANLRDWNNITAPIFVAKVMAHASTVIMAFVGGKLIPTEPHNQREGEKERDNKWMD